MHRDPRSWCDKTTNLVHEIPGDWGVRSFKTLCGIETFNTNNTKYEDGYAFTHNALTCFWCIQRIRR